jgi:hypothetical protein
MFEKYIVINEAKIICGQTGSGTWYCKELPAKNTNEMDALICEVNSILNKYNANEEKESAKDKKIKGLV